LSAASRSDQFAGTAGLSIDGQAVALAIHPDTALSGKGVAIRQNQVDIAGDGDAVGNFHIAVDNIPAAAPFSRLVINHGDIVRSLFLAVFVQIFHII